MNVIELFEDIKVNNLTLIDALKDFLPMAVDHLKLPGIPKIKLVKDIEKSKVPTFGRFTNDDDTVYVAVNNRNPNDIIRTLAHELTHFKQRTEHELGTGSWHTGSPEENQAHDEAGIMMRNFNSKYPQYLKMKPVIVSDNASTKHIDEDQKPKLIKIHYFDVDQPDLAQQAGLNYKNGRWCLYQFDTSGAGFNQKFAQAVRLFGRPH
jgi:hypothetical protein